MHKFIYKIFIQVVVIALNTQLLFGPIAYADQSGGWNKAAQTVSNITSMIGQATQAYMQGSQGAGGGVERIQAQLAPHLQIRPVDQNQIPPVFQGCFVLPASPNELTGGYSCENSSNEQVQAGYTEAVINIAEFNKKQLKNFLTNGHERFTTQGVGCYEKKMEDFNGMLLAREEELRKFQNALKEKIEAFKLATKSDLESMRKDSAMLTGKPDKYLKDIKLEDYFFGAQDKGGVCGSVIDQATIAKAGRKGGLIGIEENIFESMNNKSRGYTPDEILTKSSGIERDLSDLVNSIGSTNQKRNDMKIDLNSVNLNSKYFDKGSKSLKKAVELYNAQIDQDLKTIEQELKVNQAVSNSKAGKNLLNLINEGEVNIERRLAVFERDVKKECVEGYIKSNWGSVDAFTKEFRNPNVSKKLSNSADNAFASEMAALINDPDVSIEQALKNISDVEQKGLNSSKIIVTGKSFSINGKTVSASTPLRASQMYRILSDNCKQIYTSRKNSDGFTQSDMVSKLMAYGNRIERMRKSAPTKIKSDLKKQLLECPADKETGVGALSCTDALNMNSNNFCLRTAKVCAGNFKGCYAKAQEVKKAVRDKQVATATKYNAEVGKLKGQLKTDLLSLNQFMESKARSLDAQLSLGTVFQINELKFNLNENFLYSGKEALDEELNIEDPEKILKMASQQVKDLSKQLEQQRKEFVGGNGKGGKLGEMSKQYAANYKTHMKEWDNVIGMCKKRIGDWDRMKADADKSVAETNDQIRKACMELQAFNRAPECDSIGELMETVQEAMMIAPMGQNAQMADYYNAQTLGNLQEIKASCSQTERQFVPKGLAKDFNLKDYCDKNQQAVAEKGFTGSEGQYICSQTFDRQIKDYPTQCTNKDKAEYLNKELAGRICKDKKSGNLFKIPSKDGECMSKDTSDEISDNNDDITTLQEYNEKIEKEFTNINSAEEIQKNTQFIAYINQINATLKDQGYAMIEISDKGKIIDSVKDAIKKVKEKNVELAKNDQNENSWEKYTLTAADIDAGYDATDLDITWEDSDNDKLLTKLEQSAKCWIPESTNKATIAIQYSYEYAKKYFPTQVSQAQMGEKHIAAAMCNGGFDGMYEPVGDAVNDIAGGLGAFFGSRRE